MESVPPPTISVARRPRWQRLVGGLILAAASGGVGYVAVTAFRDTPPPEVAAAPHELETARITPIVRTVEPPVETVAMTEPPVAAMSTPMMRLSMQPSAMESTMESTMVEPAAMEPRMVESVAETPDTTEMTEMSEMSTMSTMRFSVQRDWDG